MGTPHNVEIYQADYIKRGPVPYYETFVREKDFLTALAERDKRIAELESLVEKLNHCLNCSNNFDYQDGCLGCVRNHKALEAGR